jgi:hypothetical protein
MSKSRGGKLKHGPIWDYDRSLGAQRQFASRRSFEGWQPRDFEMAWWVTLFEDPDFRQKYADRYQQLREGPWSNWNLHEILDKLAAELTSEAAGRTFERWPMPLAGNPPGWAGEVELLRTWVLGRASWTDQQFIPRPIVDIVVAADADGPKGTRSPAVRLRLPEDAAAGAKIYFTLDGTDPRIPYLQAGTDDPLGTISPSASEYTGEPFTIEQFATVRARTFVSEASKHLGLDSQTVHWSGVAASVLPTDTNLDGQIGPDDVTDFVLGLMDPAAYELRHGVPATLAGDVDRDGDLDFDDIDDLLAVVESASAPARSSSPEETNLGSTQE